MAWEKMITNHNNGNFDVKEERSFQKASFTKRLVLVRTGEKGNLKANWKQLPATALKKNIGISLIKVAFDRLLHILLKKIILKRIDPNKDYRARNYPPKVLLRLKDASVKINIPGFKILKHKKWDISAI